MTTSPSSITWTRSGFLLAAGEAGVEVALGERLVHVQQLHLLAQDLLELGDADLALVGGALHRGGLVAFLLLGVGLGLLVFVLEQLLSLLEFGVERLPEEVRHRDALDLGGVLERQEDPQRGPLVRFEVEEAPGHLVLVGVDVLDVFLVEVEQDLTLGHFVGRVARDDLGGRGLPGAVGAHQRVNLPGFDLQVDPTKDALSVLGDLRVQIVDFECSHS